MDKQQRRKSSPEIRERAVRLAIEHRGDHASQWAAIVSIAAKIGCTAQTLHNRIAQAERDRGLRAGSTTDERERMKALERENRELREYLPVIGEGPKPKPRQSSEGKRAKPWRAPTLAGAP
jgi:transposase